MSDVLKGKLLTNPWVVLPLVALAAVLAAYLLSAAILWILKLLLDRGARDREGRLYRTLQGYIFPLLTVGGLFLVLESLPLSPKVLRAADRLLSVSGLILSLLLLAKTALLVLRSVGARYEAMGNIQGPIESLAKIVFVAVGGMIVLDSLGLSLTPIVTTLGIGSLAIAIALQDTLGNFFAGLYIKADRPVEKGHYVRLESGHEGFVDHIGWRSTQIRTLQNNIVVVPNSKLAQTIITNFDLPDERLAISIPVGVSYQSDPQRVEEILLDEAKKAAAEVPGLLDEPDPFVRFIPGFGDFALNFTLTCYVRRFTDQFLVQHELRKRLLRRLRQEGIEIPVH